MARGMMRILDERATAATCSGERGCWQPAADVYRTLTGWLVKFDLAGICPTEIQLHRQGRRLMVSGSRRDALVQQGLCSYSLEINYNRFQRTVELPADIEATEVKTEYRDGMLLVWLTQRR